MKLRSHWSFPNSIRFGENRILEIEKSCDSANIKNPLFVTDKNLVNSNIFLKTINLVNQFCSKDCVFSDVESNPNQFNLYNGIEKFKSGRFDGVIAFGGGSALDIGKLIAFMAEQPLSVWEFEDIGSNWTKAKSEKIFPIIAIPTTAGTGSEVGRASVLSNTEFNVKKIIFHPLMLPKEVICDPSLTFDLPKKLTAGTGMDAFAHCLEAFSSNYYHPMATGIAIEGMKVVKNNIFLAYNEPKNIFARSNMMSAALMGATSFQKGLGAIHALSHSIGALFNTHHGTTNAVIMPEVLKFNREAIEEKITSICSYLEIKNNFNGFLDLIYLLNDELNIPNSLKELEIDENKIDLIAKMALEDPTAKGNPLELNLQNTTKLIENCF